MKNTFFILLILSHLSVKSQMVEKPFFQQAAPTGSAILFAPNIVSDEFGNRDMAISPKGDEMFYTLQYRNGYYSTIMFSKKIKGKWTQPEIASFCGQYNDLEPAFSPDGTKLYFSSDRPLSGTDKKDYDIWFITKTNGEWSNPQNMGSPVNSPKNEFYASLARNGNLYFTKEMEGKDEDIVVCKFSGDKYEAPVSLPETVNSMGAEFNAFVDVDEQFIIFTGYKRKGNIGSGDLFISKKNEKGEWSEAKNMGEQVNGVGNTYCPYISPDKKYFFFTSSRGVFKTPFAQKQDFSSLKAFVKSPLNGWDNIYWIDAKEVLK
ncbi:hypothetical protein [Emticicia sp. SJ17W-69]|uniref:hypothetical protein n=1 Tax=Emticicia sp. SJ17W-69 TaxID=3421657 RepID=UPI003EBF5586